MDWLFNLFGTAQASGTFLVIGIVALVVLIIGIVLDGIFDVFGFDGAVGIEVLGAFFTLFGFIGYASMGFGAEPGTAALVGGLVGVAGGAGAWAVTRWLKRQEAGGTEVHTSSMVGKTGIVTLRVPGGDNYGEITVRTSGVPHPFSALADEELEMGTSVIIDAILTDTSVKVSRANPTSEPESNE